MIPEGLLVGLDTETTGVDPTTDRIIELALIRSDFGANPVPIVDSYLRHEPRVEVPAGASEVHGITTADLDEAPDAQKVLEFTLGFLEGLADDNIPVVIYNASFDLTILAAELARYGLGSLPQLTVIDPLVLDRHFDRYRKGKRTLSAVAEHYGIELTDAHAAEADVSASIAVAREIIKRFPVPSDRKELHRLQSEAHRMWAESFTEYLARQGSERTPPSPVWLAPGLIDPKPYHYSELAAMRRCPQKHHYAYVEGLRAKREALNLKRGLWLHSMLQADALKRGIQHDSLLEIPDELDVPGVEEPVTLMVQGENSLLVLYRDDDDPVTYELSWKGMLDLLTYESDYALLPQDVIEESYVQGGQDLPTACWNIMRGYLWQYRTELPKRRPLLVEVEWERTLDGDPDVDLAGRADLVEIDERGRTLIVDWKSTASMPGQEFKLMESQRYLYFWGLDPLLAKHGVKVQGLAYDYLITKTPTIPKQNQPKKPKKPTKANPDPEQPTPNELKGELSKAKISTTPLVYYEALKTYGLELTDEHREKINELERDNEFYFRPVLPVNLKALATVLKETRSAARQAAHFREHPEDVYRNVDRSCTFMCDFTEICSAELHGQDASGLKERDYEPRS